MISPQEAHCEDIKSTLQDWGLYAGDGETGETWRIAPEPFRLDPGQARFFETLGGLLLSWMRALNRLYFESLKGRAPAWVADYLDLGKPSDLLDLARMNRFKSHLPGILRPDVLLTEDGYAITELDSVPGGFGRTAGLMTLYAGEGRRLAGEEHGGIDGLFYQMLESAAGRPGCKVALVVSDEAADYLPEMRYLGERLRAAGRPVYVRRPEEVGFHETGLWVEDGGRETAVDVVYRFYELFDLKNIPKAELIAYAMKKGRVRVTPPYKPQLEEKLGFALLHHPGLAAWWEKALGLETFERLIHLIPRTWILDPRPLPPQAVIPGLQVAGRCVSAWRELFGLSQKERERVIKTSGFSPRAWGSRGVVIGHDVSAEDWQTALEQRLAAFSREPSVLQDFHKAKRVQVTYWDEAKQSLKPLTGRARLTPYYFVIGEEARLGGILATVCPQDKKKIHGMVDAVMTPCALP